MRQTLHCYEIECRIFGDCGQFQSFNLNFPINWEHYAPTTKLLSSYIVPFHIAESIESKPF